MERATLGRSPVSPQALVAFVLALVAAVLLGGAGGYEVRGWSSPATTTSANTAQPTSQGEPDSDLTRVLPSPHN